MTTVAGCGREGLRDGPAASAEFNYPRSLALDEARGLLYVADSENECIRAIALSKGELPLFCA